MTAFDVITIGRVGIDIYPLEIGVPLEEVTTFGRFLGGSPTNVAVAAARLGRSAAVITRTGDDPFGRFVRSALAEYAVDGRWVASLPGYQTPVVFCEAIPPERFPLWYYRADHPADLEIRPDELDLDAIASAGVLWLSLTGFSQEPSRSAHVAALDARRGHGITILDLDYRPALWRSPREATAAALSAVPMVTVVVGNTGELTMATGVSDPDLAAEALLGAGPELVAVKLGSSGALARSRAETVRVAALPVEIVNGLGCGDGFGGALCHGLLAGWDLGRIVRFANAAGAIVATRLACAPAMPTTAEVEALLAGSGDG